jgi:alkylhydroperoxidase family enzyme
MLAHGAELRKNFFSLNELKAIVKDFHNSSLPVEEVTMMSFAQKVITQTHLVNQSDIDELRTYGLSDDEILDVILVSTARSFISKTVDALGAVPDKVYQELEPELLQLLNLSGPFPQNQARH